MDHIIIAKTLLNIWPGLKDYEAMLASRAQVHALCSFQTPLLTERIMDKIIDLNVRQQTIHTLRVGLEKIISRLDATTQRVLRSYYHPTGTAHHVELLAAQLGISPRSYFRKLAQAINVVARHLPQLDINFFSWQYLLNHHHWIREVFTRELKPHRRPRLVRDTH